VDGVELQASTLSHTEDPFPFLLVSADIMQI
jgi:hypothetical protein